MAQSTHLICYGCKFKRPRAGGGYVNITPARSAWFGACCRNKQHD